MGLKGGRRLVVRDRVFRWSFSGKHDRFGNSPKVAHVAVQEDTERPGLPVVAWLTSLRWVTAEAHDMDCGGVPHRARFTPGDARRVVEAALDAGWNPTSRKPYEVAAGLELADFVTTRREG